MAPELVARGTLFVDSRAAALVESGDVVQGIAAGLFGPDHIRAELGEVVGRRATGRASPAELTIFKSLGLAVEDVAAAHLAYTRAVERGLGTLVDTSDRGPRSRKQPAPRRRRSGWVGMGAQARMFAPRGAARG